MFRGKILISLISNPAATSMAERWTFFFKKPLPPSSMAARAFLKEDGGQPWLPEGMAAGV
jgi:hypothetical protein